MIHKVFISRKITLFTLQLQWDLLPHNRPSLLEEPVKTKIYQCYKNTKNVALLYTNSF